MLDKEIEIKCIRNGLKVVIPQENSKKLFIEPIHTAFWEVIDTIKTELDI